MVRHRTHSIEFKRQIAQEYVAGETLHALAKRHDLSRNLIRIWVTKMEAGAFDDDAQAADLLQSGGKLPTPIDTRRPERQLDSGDIALFSSAILPRSPVCAFLGIRSINPGALLDYFAAMRSFIRSVELGSFSRAAAESGVKVSTISRYVSALEADIGAALLNRSTHGLHLTEIGRMFHERASRIVVEVDDARALASSFNAAPQGKLKITAPAAFGRLHVVAHLSDFLAAYPAISVEATLTDTHIDMIETGVDLAIRIGALPNSGLIARRLAEHQRVLCASPAFLDTSGPIERPEDIASHEALTSLLQPGNTWHFRDRGTRELESVKVAGRIRLNDSEALLTCALAGQGLALLPTWLAGTAVARGALVVILPDWEAGITPDFDRAIWVVYPPKKVVSPKVRAFIRFFEARFQKPVYWNALTPDV